MKVTNTEYMNKVLPELAEYAGKWIQNIPEIRNGSFVDQYVDVGMVLWYRGWKLRYIWNPKHTEYLEVSKNFRIRWYWEFVHYHQEIDNRQFRDTKN